jgi:hypothetical protein
MRYNLQRPEVRRVTRLNILVFLFLAAAVTLALDMQQAECLGQPGDWALPYGGTADDAAYCLIQTDDGGYALAGHTESFGAGETDYYLVKIDSSGNEEWSRTYGEYSFDEACCVVQTGDGGYALAGNGFASLIRTDANGDTLWTWDTGNTVYSMTPTSDGGFALAGVTYAGYTSYFYLAKIDSNGSKEWSKTYGTVNWSQEAYSVVQTSDGGYALAGCRQNYMDTTATWNGYLVKTDAAGTSQWSKTYDNGSEDYLRCLVQTPDGGFALAGYSASYSIFDFWLVKTDASGNAQWNKLYDKFYGIPSWDEAYSLVRTSDGGYALVGWSWRFDTGNRDFWLVKVNGSGTRQWDRIYGGGELEEARSVIQTDDGRYAVAGETRSFGAGLDDFWLVKVGEWTIHDVAVTDVRAADTFVCQDDSIVVSVDLESQGDFPDTFTVIAYYYEPSVPTPAQWQNFWSMGDINREGHIDSTDYDILAAAWGTSPGMPGWNPDADLNEDLVIDMWDMNILAFNFGKDIWTEYSLVPPIGTERVLYLHQMLSPYSELTVDFMWRTTGLSPGNYTLSAYVVPITGEVDTTDNRYTNGVLRIAPDTLNLTITATAGGTTDSVPGVYPHPCGSSPSVTALPESSYYFHHWELDAQNVGAANPYSVFMDDNHTLHAVFHLINCEVAPTELDFGTVFFEEHRDTTFTIRNTNGDALVGDVTESSPHYSLVAGGGPFNLASGESLVVTVRFEPDSTGQIDCTVETGCAICNDVACTGVGDDASSVKGDGIESIPTELRLGRISPNPFRLTSEIRYDLPRDCDVVLEIYSVLGQKVAVLVDSHEEAGYKAVHWNTKNEKGTSLPGGVYFCRLQACGRVFTQKLVLLE